MVHYLLVIDILLIMVVPPLIKHYKLVLLVLVLVVLGLITLVSIHVLVPSDHGSVPSFVIIPILGLELVRKIRNEFVEEVHTTILSALVQYDSLPKKSNCSTRELM